MKLSGILPRLLISGMLFALFYLHITGKERLELIDRVESFLYDARVRLSAPNTVDPRIVIVDIDERSLAAEGRWPWSRAMVAKMVNRLFDEFGVQTLGFDVLFAEAERSTAAELIDGLIGSPLVQNPELNAVLAQLRPEYEPDRQLAAALSGRDAYLGLVFGPPGGIDPALVRGGLPEPLFADSSAFSVPFVRAGGHIGNLEILQGAARGAGFFDNPLVSSDGSYRRVPLVQEYQGKLYQSLALALSRQVLGNPPLNLHFDAGDVADRTGMNLEHLWFEDLRRRPANADSAATSPRMFPYGTKQISVDEQLAVLVPYRGPQGSFPYVSATDVLNAPADELVETLFDAVVLVGTTAPGLLDLRPTPMGKTYPGVEVHANIISGILDGAIKHRPQYMIAVELLMLLTIGLSLALLLPRLGPLSGFGLVVALVAGVSALNLWFWFERDAVLPLASPILYITLASLLQIVYGYSIENRSKRRLVEFFGTYVPPEVARDLDTEGANLSLQGDAREMTVLFSDVRGFTSISEGLEPRELTQLMNDFLTPITRDIHEHGGTIDKYMGDAVMAFWGAPTIEPLHPRKAVEAGMAMIRTMRELSEELRAEGKPELRIGVGINTGVMNVGNMGSEFRMAYTVLGDAVNLGSRIEGLTKMYGVDIACSEETARCLPDWSFRLLDRVRVKGRAEPVTVLEPLGETAQLSAESLQELDCWQEFLDLYQDKRWGEAIRLLAKLKSDWPATGLYDVYAQRLEGFSFQPPPRDWDGVTILDSK